MDLQSIARAISFQDCTEIASSFFVSRVSSRGDFLCVRMCYLDKEGFEVIESSEAVTIELVPAIIRFRAFTEGRNTLLRYPSDVRSAREGILSPHARGSSLEMEDVPAEYSFALAARKAIRLDPVVVPLGQPGVTPQEAVAQGLHHWPALRSASLIYYTGDDGVDIGQWEEVLEFY